VAAAAGDGVDAPLIEARELRFSYRVGEEILKGVSFKIHAGELVAVTGPSGSGKSTLFYLLGCLLDRYKGEVFYQGTPTRELDPSRRAWLRNQGVGFVFQQFYLLPRASVLDNILLPTFYPYDHSAPSPADRERALSLATKLGIEDLLERRPQELSGGQQQRVAIARALLRDPPVILADEPTGNLDTKSSAAVMEILESLHREGRTVIIVTHSPDIAARCQRVLRVRDGLLEADTTRELTSPNETASPIPAQRKLPSSGSFAGTGLRALLRSVPASLDNIRRSKAKSLLTMLGVSLGVAAVLSTMSLGSYAKDRILEGYESLGVNTLRFIGYPNWRRSGTGFATSVFRDFKMEADIRPLLRVFPQIQAITPLRSMSDLNFSFGGLSYSENTGVMGVNENFFAITGSEIVEGRGLSAFDLESASPVCVIGAELRKQLFPGLDPIGKQLSAGEEGRSSLSCRIIGVLDRQPSAQEGAQPDSQIFIPETFFVRSATTPWERELHHILIKIAPGFDPAEMGAQFEGFFVSRYGDTGEFRADSDTKLLSQMKLFLDVFSGLLTAVALIALLVGGVGINNMMLANLSERLKELGLRKALGATPRQLRFLVLSESLLLCFMAGIFGLIGGFVAYQGLVLGATRLIPKLEYQWIFEPTAFVLSFAAIFITGMLSGLIPALRAERLDVMEALRQDA
jgi:macrolide transport system ATP-binding/permease protein